MVRDLIYLLEWGVWEIGYLIVDEYRKIKRKCSN